MNSLIDHHSPFSNATYRKLFLAQATSLAGTGITTIALALLAWDLAGDQAGQVLGTALALKMVAYVLLSPLIGSFAHKLPRRIWFIGLDLFRALFVLCLPFITQVWQIYVLLFLINAGSAGFTPVFQATIADVIKDEEQYHKALSYSRLAFNLEQLLSPSLTALLLTFMSYHTLFVLDSITFVLSACFIFACTLPQTEQVERSEKMIDNLKFGIVAFLKTPRLRALFSMYVAVACASAMVITNTVVYVIDLLQGTESQTAIAMAVSGAGSMIAALLLPKWLLRLPIRQILLSGTALLAVTLFIAASTPGWGSFLCLWFLIGIGLSLVQTPAGALIRASCQESDAPALFAANFSLSHLCWLGAYPLVGYLGSLVGLEFTFFLIGGISLLFLVIAWKIYPNPDELELEHTHQEMAHEHAHQHDQHHDHLHSEETGKQHRHFHQHHPIKHKHKFMIDHHHQEWP